MKNEDQPEPEGPARYEFSPPEPAEQKIEFKKVRRVADTTLPAERRKKKSHKRLYVGSAAGVVVLLLVTTAWVAYQGSQAKNHLQTAAGLFLQLQDQIKKADVRTAQGTLAALQKETRAARDSTGGGPYVAEAAFPFA